MKSPAWDYDWDSARWVHLKTRTKSRPQYIGFVDEDEGPRVYLLRPLILRGDEWVDSWTWREKIGPLPSLGSSGDSLGFFGEVIVYKWDIVSIQEIDFPGEIDRCWYCGKKVSQGRFCEPKHELVFRAMNLDFEMLDNEKSTVERWTTGDSLPDLEKQFDIQNIKMEIENAATYTQKEFGRKIDILSKLIEHETKLSGIYFHQCLTKEVIGISYRENRVLNNTVANQPYRSISILMLTRKSLYGSARPILRQFFESLIIAKYAEYDSKLAKAWHEQNESTNPSRQVSIGRDVLNSLSRKGKAVEALRETWRNLCATSHATRSSQQVLRVPNPSKPNEFEEYLQLSTYFPNTEYSLDLLFLMLAMNYHLIREFLATKASGWWFGDVNDAYGSYKRERLLNSRISSLIKKYMAEGQHASANEMLKQNIMEYRTEWT